MNAEEYVAKEIVRLSEIHLTCETRLGALRSFAVHLAEENMKLKQHLTDAGITKPEYLKEFMYELQCYLADFKYHPMKTFYSNLTKRDT